MGINVHIMWVCIDLVMVVYYNRNVYLTLDADFILLLRRGAHRLTSVLERGFQRLAFELRREATVARVLTWRHDATLACVSMIDATIGLA